MKTRITLYQFLITAILLIIIPLGGLALWMNSRIEDMSRRLDRQEELLNAKRKELSQTREIGSTITEEDVSEFTQFVASNESIDTEQAPLNLLKVEKKYNEANINISDYPALLIYRGDIAPSKDDMAKLVKAVNRTISVVAAVDDYLIGSVKILPKSLAPIRDSLFNDYSTTSEILSHFLKSRKSNNPYSDGILYYVSRRDDLCKFTLYDVRRNQTYGIVIPGCLLTGGDLGTEVLEAIAGIVVAQAQVAVDGKGLLPDSFMDIAIDDLQNFNIYWQNMYTENPAVGVLLKDLDVEGH